LYLNELLENTDYGIYFIDKYITFWPGGKVKPDHILNSMIGDNISSILGWFSAYYLDMYSKI